jgi:hypothetical protein
LSRLVIAILDCPSAERWDLSKIHYEANHARNVIALGHKPAHYLRRYLMRQARKHRPGPTQPAKGLNLIRLMRALSRDASS